jgi:hypothetical protein
MKFLIENYLGLTDEDIRANKEAKEKKEKEKKKEEKKGGKKEEGEEGEITL